MDYKTGVVLLLVGLAAFYTFYTPHNEDDPQLAINSLPEFYW
jgi:hypothetical protein